MIWKQNKQLSIGSLIKPYDIKPIIFEINSTVYESIMDASLISEDDDNYTLLVACKVINLNQIHLFDAVKREHLNKKDKDNALFR